jgi:hypothetical protein
MTAITEADENQPLLPTNGEPREDHTSNFGDDIVDFDPNGDPENPMDWPTGFKWGIVALLAFMAFTVWVLGQIYFTITPR